jgi:hypothetical protein
MIQKNFSFLPELGAFGIGLLLARWFHWQAADLIWSLWLSSLVLGYATILSTIVGGAYVGAAVLSHPQFPSDKKLLAISCGAAAGVFFLGFFSVHFGAFHAIHASFLQNFFPLEQVEERVFTAGFMNPFKLWVAAVVHVLPRYGWFLLPMLIVERHAVFKAFSQCLKLVAQIKGSHSLGAKEFTEWREQQRGKAASGGSKKNARMGNLFAQPYTNVIKMHAMIFVLAGCLSLNLDNFVVYCVISAVYFFPWRAVIKTRSKE